METTASTTAKSAPKGGRQAGTPAKAVTFDWAIIELNKAYARFYNDVDHYTEMEKMATTTRGRHKWSHARRLAQKMKDDVTAALRAYEDGRSLQKMATAVEEAQEERAELIEWIKLHPGASQQEPIERAKWEARYLETLLRDILKLVRDKRPGTPEAAEAERILARHKAPAYAHRPDRRQRSGTQPRKPLNR